MKIKRILVLGFLTIIISASLITVNALSNTKKVQSLLTNKEISVTFSKSKQASNKNYKIFLDDEDNQYIYNGDNLIGFYKDTELAKNASAKKVLSQTEINNKLETYKSVAAEKLNIINSVNNTSRELSAKSDYVMIDSYYHEGYNEYTYSYAKKIDGYITNDGVTVSVDENGELVSLAAPRQGLFDDYLNVQIDETKVAQFIEENMTSDNYPNMTEYEINYEYVSFNENNQLVLVIGIGMELNSGMRTTTILYYQI